VKIGTAGISKTSLPSLNMLVRVFLAGSYFGPGISQLIVGDVVFMAIFYDYCYKSEICALSEKSKIRAA